MAQQLHSKESATSPSAETLATIDTPENRVKINLHLIRYWCIFTPQHKAL